MTILKLHTIAINNGYYVKLDGSSGRHKLVVTDSSNFKWVNVQVSHSELEEACKIVHDTMKERKLWA